MAKGALDLFMLYQFLRKLVKPFDKWDAYQTGVIDRDGNVIVKKGQRTSKQDSSWGYYDRLIANLKKLLAKIPGGSRRISSFAAALLLLREEKIDPDDVDFLEERLNYYLENTKYLQEEVPPANVVGSGNIHGVGVGPYGEPGVKRKKKDEVEQSRGKEMSDETNVPVEDSKPFWESKIFWTNIVSVGATLGVAFGLDLTPEDQTTIVTAALAIVSMVNLGLRLVTKKSVTLTKKKE